ncbi:hypothetical protein CHU98_g8877 [Xylaria longipes]|nr:hypothetical protein CHU98_g8877 [Xylaria longipes]
MSASGGSGSGSGFGHGRGFGGQRHPLPLRGGGGGGNWRDYARGNGGGRGDGGGGGGSSRGGPRGGPRVGRDVGRGVGRGGNNPPLAGVVPATTHFGALAPLGGLALPGAAVPGATGGDGSGGNGGTLAQGAGTGTVGFETSGYLAYSGTSDNFPAMYQHFAEENKIEPGDRVHVEFFNVSERRKKKQAHRAKLNRIKFGIESGGDTPMLEPATSTLVEPSSYNKLFRGRHGFALPGSSRQKKPERDLDEIICRHYPNDDKLDHFPDDDAMMEE